VRVFDRNLHSRMPLVPTPARLKRCDKWHSSRVSTFLPVRTVICVQTLKALRDRLLGSDLVRRNAATVQIRYEYRGEGGRTGFDFRV
jgi:hypothetical protein